VLTLQLPHEPDAIPRFLEHVWIFDRAGLTDEDRKRTALYKQNIDRERFRGESLTLQQFLDGLELEVRISRIEAHHLERASQLTQRTNQFNMTTIRRNVAELQELCRPGKLDCLIVEVGDRFGDYGLVGLVLYELCSDTLKVDTFLMSCRVLGRGIEHRMLAALAGIAKDGGAGVVEVGYFPTQRNPPALKFLNSVGAELRRSSGEGFRFRFPVDYAAALTYRPVDGTAAESAEPPHHESIDAPAGETSAVDAQTQSEQINHIATMLS
jgi:FkbH-like protein